MSARGGLRQGRVRAPDAADEQGPRRARGVRRGGRSSRRAAARPPRHLVRSIGQLVDGCRALGQRRYRVPERHPRRPDHGRGDERPVPEPAHLGDRVQRAAEFSGALRAQALRDLLREPGQPADGHGQESARRVRGGGDTAALISASEVVVAILAHLGLPPFAPPLARARSPGFDFTGVAMARAGADGAGDVARAKVCREDDVREVLGGFGGVVFPSTARGEEGAGGVVVARSAWLGLASGVPWVAGRSRLGGLRAASSRA